MPPVPNAEMTQTRSIHRPDPRIRDDG